MRIKTRHISLILFLSYVSAVGILCLIKTDSLPEMPSLWLGIPADKVAHFCMFTPFPLLSYLSLMPGRRRIMTSVIVTAVLTAMGAAFAYGTELLQGQTGYRSYDINDFYADLAGLSFGAAVTATYFITKALRDRKK